ncbi:MAG TPA: 2-oxoglutarate and iron-dependent oxygenase domain-containing protein [Steroidobacteraceae bacterium]|jgi:polar amino acid transport system ATP-binding protein|nr:2-oxoglutarate and iron-dependent oxygenase domain-containing protein [Steroidobacteraceae bacterium]
MSTSLPVIDLRLASQGADARTALALQLDLACSEFGFFYLVGHEVGAGLTDGLLALAREFFAREQAEKMQIHMSRGGRAWRGYFPLGGELTSGQPDLKEGLYFGTELDDRDPRVQAGLPMHGSNLFPDEPGFRATVLEYMSTLESVGQQVLSLMAEGLHLDGDYFERQFTADPTVLFRIFRYPPDAASREGWGVGAHTDYGLLTLLQQDTVGGLQVLNRDRWLDVPPLADSLVCNVGDMLERLTNGRYLSALHRAKNLSARERLSMVLFLDPSFDAKLEPLPGVSPDSSQPHTNVRWDRIDPHALQGTYGEYLLSKVSKVFPELAPAVR